MEKPVKKSGSVISEAEVDVEAIMADVKASARRNRQKALSEGLSAIEFIFDDDPDKLPSRINDPSLYEHLLWVNQPHKIQGVHPRLQPSVLTRLPGIGRYLEKLQATAHSLAIFYVNTFASEVINLQSHVAAVLNYLVGWNQRTDKEMVLLRQEIEALQERIRVLEAEK